MSASPVDGGLVVAALVGIAAGLTVLALAWIGGCNFDHRSPGMAFLAYGALAAAILAALMTLAARSAK